MYAMLGVIPVDLIPLIDISYGGLNDHFWPSGHQSRNGHQRPLWELNIAHVKKHPHLPTKMLLSPTVRNLPPPTPLSKCLPYKEFGHIIFSNSASRYKLVHIKPIRFYFFEGVFNKIYKNGLFWGKYNPPPFLRTPGFAKGVKILKAPINMFIL